MSNSPLQPPVPFADFEFTFDPSLSNLFPNPPPLPSSADLFSPAETSDLLGFLDNFGDFNWEAEYPPSEPLSYDHLQSALAPYSNPHLKTTPEPSASSRSRNTTRTSSARGSTNSQRHPEEPDAQSSTQSDISINGAAFSANDTGSTASASSSRPKPLLSTPQKRLNHIMSEQKRRNAIRDGYGQLIALLAPAGSGQGIGMPTRGRPKGSGSRGKGQSKGKSGVLFRAVEYCRWLEEGRDALKEEVLRVEAASGIRSS